MSCNNCKCNNVIRANSYTVGETFNINTTFDLDTTKNGKRYVLVLNEDLPSMTTIVPVTIIVRVNGTDTAIPVQDIIGNNLMSDQLRFIGDRKCCDRVIRIIFGNNPNHFKVLQCLPRSIQGGNV